MCPTPGGCKFFLRWLIYPIVAATSRSVIMTRRDVVTVIWHCNAISLRHVTIDNADPLVQWLHHLDCSPARHAMFWHVLPTPCRNRPSPLPCYNTKLRITALVGSLIQHCIKSCSRCREFKETKPNLCWTPVRFMTTPRFQVAMDASALHVAAWAAINVEKAWTLVLLSVLSTCSSFLPSPEFCIITLLSNIISQRQTRCLIHHCSCQVAQMNSVPCTENV
jgi:hypothetical protein